MKHALAIVLLLLAGCATNPPVNAPVWSAEHRNACVPEAAAMAQGLRDADIPAHVLIIQTATWTHAVAVYLYGSPSQVWVWDSTWKSLAVRAYFDNPAQVARAWVAIIKPGTEIVAAKYLE